MKQKTVKIMKQKTVLFDSFTIDNNAIFLVIDQLCPFLKYDPDSAYRVLDLDHENILEKHLVLYTEIFLSYIAEYHKHSVLCHYEEGYPESWSGEQTCLSVVHCLNQKSWWLLYYFAVRDACESHFHVPDEVLNRISSRTVHLIPDENIYPMRFNGS